MACIDRFWKHLTIEGFEKANNLIILNILDHYIHKHGIPWKNRLDQTGCLIRNKARNCYKINTIHIITAPTNDHKAIGLVEPLITAIKNCIKLYRNCIKFACNFNEFTNEESLISVVYQLRLCK